MRWSRAVFLSLFTAFGFVACSSGGGGGMIDGGLGPIGAPDAETLRDTKRDTRADVEEEGDVVATSSDSSADVKKTDSATESGTKCPAVCSTDFECQSMCPSAPSGGVNCCDTFSGVCYATSSGGCAGTDGGID